MGISKGFGREHQGIHFNRDTFPLQSAIVWLNTPDGLIKEYLPQKDSAYSSKIPIKSMFFTVAWVL